MNRNANFSFWRALAVLLLLLTSMVNANAQTDDGSVRIFLPFITNNGIGQEQPAADEGDEPLPDDLPLPSEPPKIALPMDIKLFEIEQRFSQEAQSAASVAALQQTLANEGVTMNSSGRIHVEIVAREDQAALAPDFLTNFDAVIGSQSATRLEAWLPLSSLSATASQLPIGYFLERANEPVAAEVVGEGPVVTNSASYRVNGARTNCAGLTLAVIDLGFNNLTQARTNGDAPAANITFVHNLTTDTNFEGGIERHGTGVLEAFFDHCPGAAAWHLYRIDVLTDLQTAIIHARDNNVSVIAHSLAYFNTGWADNSGDACAAINQLSSPNRTLIFTSAGNHAQEHWQGNFSSPDNDGWHDWSTGDESIDISIPTGRTIEANLSWDTALGTANYDLYLYDATDTTELAKSDELGNRFESLTWPNNTGATQTVHLRVFHRSGGSPAFEVFTPTNGAVTWLEHQVTQSSTPSPSNCITFRVVSVGAVAHGDFGNVTNNIQPYSSRGPTNGGFAMPDLVGPTNTTGFTYPNGFGGTSSAAPNAAGAAAAFWASAPGLNGFGLIELLRSKAGRLHDWGTTGVDNTYGAGGIALFAFAPNTSWVDRHLPNFDGYPVLPYFYVHHAQTNTPANGRVVILSGSYPEPITLTKPMTYHSIGTAVLGQ